MFVKCASEGREIILVSAFCSSKTGAQMLFQCVLIEKSIAVVFDYKKGTGSPFHSEKAPSEIIFGLSSIFVDHQRSQ